MITKIYKILQILINKSRNNFILMCFLLGFELLVIAISVFSLIPLADYILDSSLENPSKFSYYIFENYD